MHDIFLIVGISLVILNFINFHKPTSTKIKNADIRTSQLQIAFSKNNFPSKIFQKNFNYVPPFV